MHMNTTTRTVSLSIHPPVEYAVGARILDGVVSVSVPENKRRVFPQGRINPFTLDDVPADLLGSWWVYGKDTEPQQVIAWDQVEVVELASWRSFQDLDYKWLLTAYTRVPAPLTGGDDE